MVDKLQHNQRMLERMAVGNVPKILLNPSHADFYHFIK